MCMHSGKHIAHRCSFFMYSCSTYIEISLLEKSSHFFHALKFDSSPYLCKFLGRQESKPESDEEKEKLKILRNFNSSNDENFRTRYFQPMMLNASDFKRRVSKFIVFLRRHSAVSIQHLLWNKLRLVSKLLIKSRHTSLLRFHWRLHLYITNILLF